MLIVALVGSVRPRDYVSQGKRLSLYVNAMTSFVAIELMIYLWIEKIPTSGAGKSNYAYCKLIRA